MCGGKQRDEPDYTIAEKILGAGVLCVWGVVEWGFGSMGKNGVCAWGMCLGEKMCVYAGSVCGKKVCLCGEGKGFFMHGKRLLYSIDLLGGGAGTWGKNAPTLSYPPSRIPKMKKLEL